MTDEVIAEGANAVRESLRQPDSYWTHLWKGLKYRSTDGEPCRQMLARVKLSGIQDRDMLIAGMSLSFFNTVLYIGSSRLLMEVNGIGVKTHPFVY
ncbi:hypothetical protein SAMN05444126_106137 [Salisediminibacterium halotolerans]|uniref:Uncharacterized protein n=1 Tax=Salisediminibacterium halotolerans TaxID=517425 RepID=A0A1H9SBV9_9BACI|nr:hypothetical protein SAMN05444126_106137 [Salisediminibacterium haloalkalitolerans]